MEEPEDVLGLGLSPSFRFQPVDEELVEYYLLRRILGQQLPLEGMIFEDDPLSAPPWKLLDKHKRKDEAFFFANGQPIHGEGRRQNRSCVGGGTWQGQKPLVDGDRLTVDSSMEITWKKYMLNFHLDGNKGSTGWVMHEYSITAPMVLASSSLRLYGIRFSGYGANRQREPDDYRQARTEPDLLEEHSSAANSVFPTVDQDYSDQEYQYQYQNQYNGGSAMPAVPSYSDQEYQYQNQYNGGSAMPAAPSYSHQDYEYQNQYQYQDQYVADLVDGSTMNLGAHSATPSSDQGHGAPGVMSAAAPFGQESFSGAIDESCMDFELPGDFNVNELLDFSDPWGSEAPLHDQLM
ncbi:unnamed protein product [Alopecurus aequalis]